MALRLRRGTDAERQLITPAEGELIYTTDTKSVYIGDGVTVGGIIVSGEIGLGDLAEVDLSTPPAIGQVLKWDGTQFVPSDDLQGSGSGATSIFDLSDVFAFTPPDPGNTLIFDGTNFTPDRIRTIFGDDSSPMLDTATNTFIGNFVGDGSGLTNLPGGVGGSIFDLSDVFAFTPPDPGDILIFDGSNFTPDRIRAIFGDDSSVMLDTATNTFIGNFVGDGAGLINLNIDLTGTTQQINVEGDVRGSIFGDDSTLIIDGLSGEINATVIRGSNILIAPNQSGSNDFSIAADDDRANLRLVRQSDLPISDTAFLGTIFFDENENGLGTTRALIASTTNVMVFGIDETGAFNNPAKYLSFTKDGNFGVGTFQALAKIEIKDGSVYLNDSRDISTIVSPLEGEMTYDRSSQTIVFGNTSEWRNVVSYSSVTNLTELPGSVTVAGDISAAALKGSLMADDSTTIVDAISGNITAPGYVQFGSFTKSERDVLTAINGMVIYNTTSNKFQGYQNNTWINLDDGIADP